MPTTPPLNKDYRRGAPKRRHAANRPGDRGCVRLGWCDGTSASDRRNAHRRPLPPAAGKHGDRRPEDGHFDARDRARSRGDQGGATMAEDSLAGWRDGPAKQAIIDFVAAHLRRGRIACRSGRGACRRVRQRRHAVVREADADPARLHPSPPRRDGGGAAGAARAPAVEGRRRRAISPGSARSWPSTTQATTPT